ncbi:cytosine permease [Pseudooceanicola sp. CBS1P-1]|uniref:Cytosine permease n=1 Tax=Pseudooceanicola albus TaxID=2692189 RepID=A0A6L7G0H2_9RHOB|nr:MULTISPECIES: cytosine permease [Pseudooceanicola]MBT9383731.1 cytosine permease [Pseudooceanicola endophyticus]MXN17585.1 cytosine permease [Pseudooceanicola albus]
MSSEPLLETRSFDFVPESERHGNVRSQVQLWFMVNAQILTIYTGAVGIAAGLSLGWALLAIVAGSLVGTLFQAFHGAQGPVMGLPQMIQSRVQFGSRGVLLPILAATLSPFGFAVFLIQTASYAVGDVTGIGALHLLQIVIAALAGLIAIVGFRMVMKIEKFASWLTLINFALLTLAVFTVLPVGTLFATGGVSAHGFFLQFGVSAIYQLAIAPLVSDYTRYLPAKTSGAKVSASVFFGTTLSAVWLEGIGAVLTAAFPGLDTIAAVRQLGDSFGFGLGTFTMIVAALSCLITTSITAYSGTLALISGLEAFRPLKPTARLRFVSISIGMVLAVLVSFALTQDTLNAFGAYLALLGYVLIPWTAVNLTDYYCVRKGRYSITDIMRPDGGLYGTWGGIGLISYVVGFLAMVPFFSSALYTGPIAAHLGGVDISFVVGLAVSSLLYLLLARRLDLGQEMAAVRAAPLNTWGHS